MRTWHSVQAEILASLAVVLLTSTVLIAALLIHTHAAQIESLRPLIGRSLLAEAQSPTLTVVGGSGPAHWWLVEASGVKTLGANALSLEAEDLALVEQVRVQGRALLQAAHPWEPVRFAAPVHSGETIAVARISPVVPGWILGILLVVDAVVFFFLGSYLLRRRVVLPLSRLALSARAIGDGARSTRVLVEGEGEVAEVARAFNEMTSALELRGDELQKAVTELRSSNAHLRQAQDELMRTERLAAVGTLAAGVAHEVGNPMGALLAFLELARRDSSTSKEADAHLARAAEQGGRVREILRQLLDFSRPPRAERVPVAIAPLVDQTTGLLMAQKRYSALDVEVIVEGELPNAMADEGMVAQILLNLVLNAGDAALERSEPRLEIRLRAAPLRIRSGDDPAAAAERRAPDAIECIVSDSGPGVADDDHERIFDPFFTTKDPGLGTGLGLANSVRLAEELGGVLELLDSSPLGGASFALRLPVEDASSAAGDVRRDDRG